MANIINYERTTSSYKTSTAGYASLHQLPDSRTLNMYFKPALPNGRAIPLPWQIKSFYASLGWPLMDNATPWIKGIYYFLNSLGCSILLFVNQAEFCFIGRNFSDISLSVEAIVTCCILNEIILRIFHMCIQGNTFKAFLKEFFRDIYNMDEDGHPEIMKKIRRGLIPCTVYSYSYILTLISFLLTPILKLRANEMSLPYKMTLPYDYENPILYGITLAYLFWVGACVAFFIIGEAFLLANCILHLNSRYDMVQKDVQQLSSALISRVPASRLAFQFRKDMIQIFVRICNLNRFAVLLNTTYAFRIFVMFAFSAGFLCVLIFQLATLGVSTENVKYASWLIAKISELLIFGTLGSMLIQTTDDTSTMYYLSNWEEIIYHSTNRKDNIRLMKDLQIIMSLHKNPIRLSGFNYFDVSLDTVIKVLRGAFSYFTCLNAMKDGN